MSHHDASERYPVIGDYALLADCHSAALVSRSGSVDWACLRRFDSASAFGRLLDWDRGGCFALTPVGQTDCTRRYRGDSLVLETTTTTTSGRARIVDAFAMRAGGADRPRNQLLRVVEGVDGEVAVDVWFEPRFDYGELRPWLRHHPDAAGSPPRSGLFSAVGGDSAVVLETDCELRHDEGDAHLSGRLTVRPGERRYFAVSAQRPHELDVSACGAEEVYARLEETERWWDSWAASMTVGGRYAGHVRRSAVVLKSLTCAETGAIIAAPTTSLPEDVGGERNWDYRYTWIRDSTLVMAALEIAGHPEVAKAFRDFLMRSAAGSAENLQIMYGIFGGRYLPELTLELEGYRGSQPVRIGNQAYEQVQHDMYGQILDAAQLWRRTHEEIDVDEWRFLRQLVERAAQVWDQPDHGIWEVRGELQHFVHSKVWLWVALDRGIRMAEETGYGEVDLDRWREVRARIREAIETRGVHPEGGYFLQAFDVDEVDAALLELPMVGFVAATDERMVRTVDEIRRRLGTPPHGFLHRYDTASGKDGLSGDEGTFLMCTFWLVDVLAMQGRTEEATELFERLLEVGNDLGLFAEQFDPAAGEMIGNFPQAFTHMALINSAHQLLCAQGNVDGRRDHPWDTADRLGERRL